MAESIMTMGKNPTVAEYIADYNSEELVCSAFYLKQVFVSNANKKMLVNFSNLVIKYMPELKELKVKIELSNQEYAKYKYNPKVLSHDIYGTTELWFLILEANEMHSVVEFDSRTIYLFRTDIVEKLTRILNLETESKDYNEEQVSADLIG